MIRSTAVHFDDVLEQMYQKYRSPGGDLREKEAEIILGDPIYVRGVKMPRWNGPVTMLREPRVAIKYNASWGIPTSKDAHRQRAEYFERLREELRTTYDDLVKYACETYGDYGPLVSGIVHDHFPVSIKNRLRFLSHAKNMVSDAARLHAYLSKTRSPLFR
jgi:hypothetical protein